MDEEQARHEALRYTVNYVVKYPEFGKHPEWYPQEIKWLGTRYIVARYLRFAPKVVVTGDYDEPMGSTRDPYRVVEALVDTAFGWIHYVQAEQTTRAYDALTARGDYGELRIRQKDTLYTVYRISLEQGPQVIAANTFVAARLAMLTDTAPLPPERVGKTINQLVRRGYLEIVDPGKASWVVHLRSSRVLALARY